MGWTTNTTGSVHWLDYKHNRKYAGLVVLTFSWSQPSSFFSTQPITCSHAHACACAHNPPTDSFTSDPTVTQTHLWDNQPRPSQEHWETLQLWAPPPPPLSTVQNGLWFLCTQTGLGYETVSTLCVCVCVETALCGTLDLCVCMCVCV